jgi:hypothetical protein
VGKKPTQKAIKCYNPVTMKINTKNIIIGLIALALIITAVRLISNSKSTPDVEVSDVLNASSTIVAEVPSENSNSTEAGAVDPNGCITSANFVWDTVVGSCVHISKVSSSSISVEGFINVNSVVPKVTAPKDIPSAIAENLCRTKGGEWSATHRECVNVDENSCSSIGGSFNECASACRNQPEATMCTLQCVQVCEFK